MEEFWDQDQIVNEGSDMTREQRYESLMSEKIRAALMKEARNLDKENFEDLFQETAMRSWKNLERFKGGNFFGWCFCIMRHCFLNRWRQNRYRKDGVWKRKTSPTVSDISDLEEIIEEKKSVDNSLDDKMTFAMESVPGIYREMIDLVILGDFSYDEAAKRTGIPIGTVMSRLFRAKSLLRKNLEEAS